MSVTETSILERFTVEASNEYASYGKNTVVAALENIHDVKIKKEVLKDTSKEYLIKILAFLNYLKSNN